MKKIIAVILLVILCAFVTCSCNRSIGPDLTWNFTWAIVQLGNGEIIEGKVTSWRDFDQSDCVQLTINNVTYLTHYSNVILTTEKP